MYLESHFIYQTNTSDIGSLQPTMLVISVLVCISGLLKGLRSDKQPPNTQ